MACKTLAIKTHSTRRGSNNSNKIAVSTHKNCLKSYPSNHFFQSDWGNSVPSNGLGNDWTMLDPAIVSGQLSGHPDFPGALRPDSPPNWIRDNLEQLTSEPGGSSAAAQLPYTSSHAPSALTHAFNGLGLGGAGAGGSVGARRGGLGGWGGATATPPPGFSHHNHRQPLGQQGYQGFKAPEGPKIGGRLA